MKEPEINRYEFGPYRIDKGERLLHRGHDLISLPPKAIETLLVRIGNAGRITRQPWGRVLTAAASDPATHNSIGTVMLDSPLRGP